MKAKKSLGQHWLADEPTLERIVEAAELSAGETILEVGPGTGLLTRKLLASGAEVVAVEKDEALAAALPVADKLSIVADDILRFDPTQLPPGYKVVANIPYYLTSKLLQVLSESSNPPTKMVLLVQKEVAERICAEPGRLSILAVSVQLYYECKLGRVVPAQLFQPSPKVDSQLIVLNRRAEPLFKDLDTTRFFRAVKAGFSGRRKKLRSSLSGGLRISKEESDKLLNVAGIDGNRRAQELSLEDWQQLARKIK